MAMALVAYSNHRALENFQRGEQGGGAVALVVMGHGARATFFMGNPGFERSRACDL